jgi:hypothetical protein
MNQFSTSTAKSLSFSEAIAYTEKTIEQIIKNQLSEVEIEKAIANLVKNQAGARGFFVAYLTGETSLADRPTEGVIKGLQSSPKIVSDLLVKNVAMSAAMKLTHLRDRDPIAAEGSERVNRRAIAIIQKLNLAEIKQEVQELQSTIIKGEGSYQEFINKWGYDREQQAAIQQAISLILE